MTILIVDDEENIRNVLKTTFEGAGFHVLCAENGNSAIEIIKISQVNCILSDVRMPKCTGVELLDQLRTLPFEGVRPIVFMMTGGCEFQPEELITKGAIRVFSKPFDKNDILQTIKNTFEIK